MGSNPTLQLWLDHAVVIFPARAKVLISILIYIFAILLTRTVGFPHKDGDAEIERYFGNILYSGMTAMKAKVRLTNRWLISSGRTTASRRSDFDPFYEYR